MAGISEEIGGFRAFSDADPLRSPPRFSRVMLAVFLWRDILGESSTRGAIFRIRH